MCIRDSVLGCAGQSDIAGNSPDALAALNVLSGGNVIQVSLDAGTLDFLEMCIRDRGTEAGEDA